MKKKEAIQKLQRQLGFIEELRAVSPDSPEFKKWERDTVVAIKNIFPETRHHLEFRNLHFSGIYLKGMDSAVALLQSFIDEIEEYWPAEEVVSEQEVKGEETNTRDVFVVHGREQAGKQAVARFIEKLGLRAIILHEQANKGRTIIEKFEDYGNPAFAVVLLTPDDVGALASERDKLKPRARQNVIFELGFFIGKIGRERVCALYTGDVELPSDYDGILYIPMDEGGAWELRLAKEIKAAGIKVDLNRL